MTRYRCNVCRAVYGEWLDVLACEDSHEDLSPEWTI